MQDRPTEDLRLHFFTTSRFHRDSRGKLRTFSAPFRPDYWAPYLAHFSEVIIYARVDFRAVDDSGEIFDLPRVTIVPLPYYSGALDYVLKSRKIHRFISAQVRSGDDYYALWVPTPFALTVAKRAARVRAPLLAIAIGDPQGVAESIFRGPIASFLAWQSSRAMRKTMLKTDAAVYVTLRSLQSRYPTRPGASTLALSDVRFPELAGGTPIESSRRVSSGRGLSLVAVGSQNQNYKGHDLLIEAVSRLQREGYELSLTIIGQGELHDALVRQAAREKVANVRFMKNVGDYNAVAAEVAAHDVFVMPSRTEGMPKALLEAMSVGVFSLGSTAGAIPEVLDTECVFAAGSVDALCERLRYFLKNPARISEAVDRQRRAIEEIKTNNTGNEVLAQFLGEWVADSHRRSGS